MFARRPENFIVSIAHLKHLFVTTSLLIDASSRGQRRSSADAIMAEQGPSKRRKIEDAAGMQLSRPLSSLTRDISPPVRTKRASAPIKDNHADPTGNCWLATTIRQERKNAIEDETTDSDDDDNDALAYNSMKSGKVASKSKQTAAKILPSPIQLTRIQNLPSSHNIGSVSLRDLIGDPMIKECWQFNYLLDLDFIM